jgi:phosphotransferase system enzyme I (PtsI)
MIEMTVHNAHKNGCEVGICGELAADLSLTEMFLKMNMDELSVSPSMLSELRNHIRNLH